MSEAGPIQRVLGTAGHIDHGKTALVRALTGVDTDRLPEEQKRGITIELGFAPWRLSDDVVASVVDVPGHERFVRTMVAGAAGIDAVLLVVAADDGVMPQTREHLAVCQLLGVERGLVVLSKADLADDDLLALVADDVRAAVRDTFLEGAPLIACSAVTGAGLDEVRAATRSVLRQAPGRPSAGPAFLPVDRVFTRAGFGTVVTGTLLSGELAAGDELEVLPGPRGRPLDAVIARGLEVHGAGVARAAAGTRVAVNLRGAEHDDVRRGDVVIAARSRRATSSLLAELRLLEGAPPLKDGDEIALHLGTTSVLARVAVLGARTLERGLGFVRLTTREPVVAFADQRLVVRRPGLHGQGTVGGGRVLDPRPTTGKGAHARLTRLAAGLAAGTTATERTLALVGDGRAAGVVEAALRERSPPGCDVAGALAELERKGAIARVAAGEGRYVDASVLQEVEREVLAWTTRLHRERPLVLGVSPEELRTRLPAPLQGLTDAAVARLARANALVHEDGVVRLKGHQLEGAAGAALERLEQLYAKAALTPPLDEEARKALGLAPKPFRDALSELKRQGRLRRLGELHFHTSALEDLSARVARHFERSPELSTGGLKELAGGLSRKFAIPLLEWLDAQGVTRRQGDVRVRGRL